MQIANTRPRGKQWFLCPTGNGRSHGFSYQVFTWLYMEYSCFSTRKIKIEFTSNDYITRSLVVFQNCTKCAFSGHINNWLWAVAVLCYVTVTLYLWFAWGVCCLIKMLPQRTTSLIQTGKLYNEIGAIYDSMTYVYMMQYKYTVLPGSVKEFPLWR